MKIEAASCESAFLRLAHSGAHPKRLLQSALWREVLPYSTSQKPSPPSLPTSGR